MAKYRVEAIFTSRGYIEVEANSISEAWDIAEETDGGEFKDMPEYGSWEIQIPQLIGSKEKYTSFIDDEEKMKDFFLLNKYEFLESYSYLTEEEWDLTEREVRRCLK